MFPAPRYRGDATVEEGADPEPVVLVVGRSRGTLDEAFRRIRREAGEAGLRASGGGRASANGVTVELSVTFTNAEGEPVGSMSGALCDRDPVLAASRLLTAADTGRCRARRHAPTCRRVLALAEVLLLGPVLSESTETSRPAIRLEVLPDGRVEGSFSADLALRSPEWLLRNYIDAFEDEGWEWSVTVAAIRGSARLPAVRRVSSSSRSRSCCLCVIASAGSHRYPRSSPWNHSTGTDRRVVGCEAR